MIQKDLIDQFAASNSSEAVDEFKILADTPFSIQPLPEKDGVAWRLVMTYAEPIAEPTGDAGRRISLQIVKEQVSTTAKEIQPGASIAKTIFRDALSRVLKNSAVTEVENPADKPDLLGRINSAATRIATETRRGAGNFIIASQKLIDEIRFKAEMHHFTHIESMFKLVVEESLDDHTIVVAYKGPKTEIDAGVIIALHKLDVDNVSYAISDSYERSYDYYQVLKVR
jgi:hypothetical protein